MSNKNLDLNDPTDARTFIQEALPQALLSRIDHAFREDGSKIDLNNLTDSEAVQYAWELLPIYQAAFPELVDIQNEH